MEQEIASQVVGLGGSTDFSLWKLFLRADFVVKFVIILLKEIFFSTRNMKRNNYKQNLIYSSWDILIFL